MRVTFFGLLASSLLILGCDSASGLLGGSDTVPESAKWLGNNDTERLDAISRHFRGMDMAMAETSYRYQELFWAGQDQNWEYASYQLTKLELAIERGVERRPESARSASVLRTGVVPMRAAIERRDPEAFETTFNALSVMCNACHEKEDVAYMKVRPPVSRTSVIWGQ